MSTTVSYNPSPSVSIPLTSPIGNGVSDQSRAISSQFENVDKAALQTGSLGFPRQEASEAFFDALHEANDEGWEGYGGKVISSWVVLSALNFIKLLPTNLPIPEITIDPDGEVLFEWYRSPYRVFSVSVGAYGKIAYAGLFGEVRMNGSSFFADNFPRVLLEAIKKVYATG